MYRKNRKALAELGIGSGAERREDEIYCRAVV